MQTSKSYGASKNNVDIKLELDDLEYVFADGHNLIINPDDVSEDASDSNIVYTDGSQAVVLQSGVKHYIQTLAGETYLLGNDPDNIQQLVINTEEQSEESNGAIEYVQNDENGETIVYKFAEVESEISDSQPQAKRIKIGDTEYLTLDNTSDPLQFSDGNQFSILDESNTSENSNFQYAILNEGKLRLQICESNSIEVLNEDSIEQVQNHEPEIEFQEGTEEYVDVNDKIQEYVLVNTNISSEDIRTGKTMTLDEYLDEINEIGKLQNNESDDSKHHHQEQSHNQYINKKLLIRKNANGKSLFGKILHIEPARKTAEEEQNKDDTQECPDKEIATVNNNEIDLDVNQNQNDNAECEVDNHMQELACDDAGEIVKVENVPAAEYNRDVTEEHINFLCKTLYGLVDMPSLKKKLINHRLEIKLVEKKPSDESQESVKDIRFISGMLTLHDHGFVLDASKEQGNTTSLTIILSQDMNNQKVTKVIFHEKPVTCHLCNRSFQSLGVLNKHIQNYHSDKALTCNVCQVKFDNHVLMNKHRKSSGHYFDCSFCNKRFTTQSNLKRHQYVHAQRTECSICKTRFANVSSLSKHLLTHTKLKTYACDSCDKTFATFGDLTFHKKTHHTAKTCFCEVCGREFSRHSNMQRHAEIHKGNGDLYKCGICECSYKFISSLTRHIVQIHMTPPM